jgi:hypothetical protein
MTKDKSKDIVSALKTRRLEWLGHIIIMNETRIVKKIFEEKLEGRRGRGRPRLTWINDVEEDLRILGVKRWKRKALERRGMGVRYKGSQGQTKRTVQLQE